MEGLAAWTPGVSRRSGATTLCKELNIADLRIVVRSRKQQFCEVNIAKGTTDPKVEFSLPKFKQVQTQILIKFHPQNLNQALTSKSQPNISISTKLEIQNIDQS